MVRVFVGVVGPVLLEVLIPNIVGGIEAFDIIIDILLLVLPPLELAHYLFMVCVCVLVVPPLLGVALHFLSIVLATLLLPCQGVGLAPLALI